MTTISNNEIFSEITNLKNLVLELNINSRDVLIFEQAAKYLNVSHSYLYKLTSTNQVPCYKPNGKMLYFNKEELNSWLMKHKSLSKDEIDEQANNYLLNSAR